MQRRQRDRFELTQSNIPFWQNAVRPAGQTTADGSTGTRRRRLAGNINAAIVHGLLIAGIAAALFWLIWIYGHGLRDARYLDGWLLAGGMGLQLCFHIAINAVGLSPRNAVRWRKVHIFFGYVLIATFLSHSDFSLPDTAFEWALWSAFVLVTLSGVFGTYLESSRRSRPDVNESVGDKQIAVRRAELAQTVQSVVAAIDPDATSAILPPLPYHAWIADLYTQHLSAFFLREGLVFAHFIGSQRKLRAMTDEIDSLARYVDTHSQQKLEMIKSLVIEKDRLDRAGVLLMLTKGWLFVHVPVTYALIVLSVLHVIVAYSFSSGAG